MSFCTATENAAESAGVPPRSSSTNSMFAESCAQRWQSSMLAGEFEQAWRVNDALRAASIPDPHRFWLGENLCGKRVMLRCLHGLGDAVQFLRYAPELTAAASHLTVQVPPAMVDLARCFDCVEHVVTWTSSASMEPAWDVQVEINELPYVFRTQLNDLPLATRYLRIPAAFLRADTPLPREKGSLCVGLVWSGGDWNPSRNVPLSLMNSLLEEPGCEFWNLQGGAARLQGTSLCMHPHDACADNLLHLAALIAQLDLVITPDTLAAHLAGALGTPAFVLLQHRADWRWLLHRSDSPWYPSLRLFRQTRAGEWQPVIDDVRRALQHLARR